MKVRSGSKQNLSINVDYRIVALVLLAVIVAMLVLWRPWAGAGGSDRVVEVVGETTLAAAPDEFVFYPSYQVKSADRQAALTELNSKSETVVAELKKLGVAESKIKTNTSGYDYPVYGETNSKDATYTAQLTVTLEDQSLAQKVQDYLVTTSPTGSVSPQYGFSDAKRKELESKGRDAATKDARAKADQMGKNLGFKVGKVKSVSDGSGFNGGPIPYMSRSSAPEDKAVTSTGLPLNPGENELPYSVSVVYFIH